ncbi:MAG: lipocalin family protein, partial [Bacteroidota bacterium]|nr:lipocalin family protein [Bacteroidota bacterium]
MKKLFCILLSLSIIFLACKKEEESNSNSNINITVSNITGIWEATSLVLDGANLSSLATILYWLKADMIIEENYQYNNSNTIHDNTGNWELSGSNLIIYWHTGGKVTYQIN